MMSLCRRWAGGRIGLAMLTCPRVDPLAVFCPSGVLVTLVHLSVPELAQASAHLGCRG